MVAALATSLRPVRPSKGRINELAPGIAVAILLAIAARQIASVGTLSSLTVAVVAGIGLGNLPIDIDRLRPGLAFVARTVLRAGIVLLGMRLSIRQIGELGLPVVLVIITTVVATFFGTQALGRRLGVSGPLSLLIATGYSICGASAIATMESSTDAEKEEVAMAIGLVTLAGTIAMFALPPLGTVIGLTDDQFAIWAGASIHDVAGVVAAGSTRGSAVLAGAVVVKLTRVLLLAPLVTGVAMSRQRTVRQESTARPPLVPTFILGFLGLVALRSTGFVPEVIVDGVAAIEKFLFAVALIGLGAGVRIERLRRLGGAPLLLGALSFVVVAGVSVTAVLLAT